MLYFQPIFIPLCTQSTANSARTTLTCEFSKYYTIPLKAAVCILFIFFFYVNNFFPLIFLLLFTLFISILSSLVIVSQPP